jgi:uncharacterized RmlC-like cupin family protein
VFNATMLPGDTVYIPTGVMHGGLNMQGAGSTIAMASNFLDTRHSPQVMTEYCTVRVFHHGFCCVRVRVIG